MGGVGMAGNGTLHVVWTRSSATAGDFPSSYAAYQLPSEAPNSISPKELLKAGTGVYTGERWGDYVGVAQDPLVPSAVWQANQYSGTGTEWKTWISRLQPAGTTYVPVTPVRVARHRPGGIGLSGKFTAKVARTWQVTGVGRHPGRRGGGDRQRDGHRAGGGRLRGGHPDRDQQPAIVDDQHPARRQPGQQPDRARCRRPARCRPPTAPRPARRPTSSST